MDNRIDTENLSSPFDPAAQQNDLSAKIVVGLERISESFRVLLWDKVKRLGLSPIQIQILIFLRHHTPEIATVSALASEFNLSKPTISDAVATLEKKGLLSKEKSTTDTRSSILTLTIRGIETVRESEDFANPIKDIVNGFPPSQKEILWQALGEIILGLSRNEVISRQRMCFNCNFYNNENGSYCRLLEKPLGIPDIRIDCPEFIDATDVTT